MTNIRVTLDKVDGHILHVHLMQGVSLRVQCPDAFEALPTLLRVGTQLNLVDVTDEEGVLSPTFIVLEPDYLLDISALAECFKEYGEHPTNYLLAQFRPVAGSLPVLLGNIVNLFLDELIHGKPTYLECMRKAFRQYPIEISTNEELCDARTERSFFESCKVHFNNLRRIIDVDFPQHGFDVQDAVLEPAYICETLGIQGRLDYMQRDMSRFIEMKSGKADEYGHPHPLPKRNNQVQMLLYLAVLKYGLGKDAREVQPYLLYTKYPMLYEAKASTLQMQTVMMVRNRIVAQVYDIVHNHSVEFTESVLRSVTPEYLNERALKGRYWEQYLKAPIEQFESGLQSLSAIERTYFIALYNFVTLELFLSKTGFVNVEGRAGSSVLWLASLDEKKEKGEILCDLHIKENHIADREHPFVSLSLPDNTVNFLSNFRQGDMIVLYERNMVADNATNRMVVKGGIERMGVSSITIRLRAAQRNVAVLPAESLYAIEHDVSDATFRGVFAGLGLFLCANQRRRDLLLGQREPETDLTVSACRQLSDAIRRNPDVVFDCVAQKALAAKDYFLLMGPPGTGKTSHALRRMVELFLEKPDSQILLLAFTNRAVDEICHTLEQIPSHPDYIRCGSVLSCDEQYRHRMMDEKMSACCNRKEVRARLSGCRLYVGTLTTLLSKPDLFKLKHFDVAIIDEATQILEPQLLGLLCARNPDGRDAIGKFVMIGDHKQLPAVVAQNAEQSRVDDERLRSIGLHNLRDSLFERLYKKHLAEKDTPYIDMLYRQGRMHPAVASFSNTAFYGSRLESLGLPHQLEPVRQAVFFVPSVPDTSSPTGKTNLQEVQLVVDLAKRIYHDNEASFDASRTLGIIAPYRSQIALIKKALQQTGNERLGLVTVDTVERYQGSERDVIIYSFCLNRAHQLQLLPNLTEEQGVIIDRKLNVVLTRARRRMYIVGAPELLRQDAIFNRLLQSIPK
ncbi:MAG: AAA domain-containing protein [Bacteroidales bacterium]|nr:AAA domain-containing protein [Bacteroidales bacterium]